MTNNIIYNDFVVRIYNNNIDYVAISTLHVNLTDDIICYHSVQIMKLLIHHRIINHKNTILWFKINNKSCHISTIHRFNKTSTTICHTDIIKNSINPQFILKGFLNMNIPYEIHGYI